MVIVRLCGGLGNQMFQYAFGRCLSQKRNDVLLLETSQLQVPPPHTSRDYRLDIFNISGKLTTLPEITKTSGVLLSMIQCGRGFHREVFEWRTGCAHVVLQGFWTSELYFSEIECLLRREFTFKSPARICSHTIDTNSACAVCVHVRRGDYLSPAGDHLGFVGLDYYKKAVAFVAERVPNPHFYVFSDDMQWCIENLSFTYPHTYVHHDRPPDEFAEDDLRLMAACQHFIIANSTFSWWAAWLGSKESTIVVAPGRWFRDDAHASNEIVPSRWARL
jgi:hypothetical protein